LPLRPLNVLLPLAALPGIQILGAWDAARDGRKLRDVPRPWYGRWYSCVALWLLNAFVIVPACVAALHTWRVDAFRLCAGGMEKTILLGDYLLADKAAYGMRVPQSASVVLGARPPARGDLVVFLLPKDRTKVYVQRVLGVPGDKVEVRGKTVYVADQPIHEPYASYLDLPGNDERLNWAPQYVPAGHLFVLGDNRDNSLDSRYWGFLPISDVRGRARVVYFSWDEREKRIRWERIGRSLR
jgi:signal peptidase I